MDVIGFLCTLLGSSTVQLHGSLGSRHACACSEAGFNSQNGDSAWGVILPKSNVLLCAFLWAKRFNAKDIHKEIFPLYGGKCLSRKAVHNWVENVSLMTKRLKRRCGSGWDNSQRTSMMRVATHWLRDGTSEPACFGLHWSSSCLSKIVDETAVLPSISSIFGVWPHLWVHVSVTCISALCMTCVGVS
jgi:hypothetical protein